jgi:hypothetical protein
MTVTSRTATQGAVAASDSRGVSDSEQVDPNVLAVVVARGR